MSYEHVSWTFSLKLCLNDGEHRIHKEAASFLAGKEAASCHEYSFYEENDVQSTALYLSCAETERLNRKIKGLLCRTPCIRA